MSEKYYSWAGIAFFVLCAVLSAGLFVFEGWLVGTAFTILFLLQILVFANISRFTNILANSARIVQQANEKKDPGADKLDPTWERYPV